MRRIFKHLILIAFLAPGVSYASNAYLLGQTEDIPAENQNFELDIMAQLILAELALDRKNVSLALEIYMSTAEESGDPEIAKRATDLAVLFADLDTALKPAKIWAQGAPDDLQAQATVAAILLTQEKVNESVPYLERLQAVDPEHVSQHYQVLYNELKKPEEKESVIQALEALIKKRPNASGAYVTLSSIFLMRSQAEQAYEISEQAISQGFKEDLLPVLHAQALHQLNRVEEALSYMTDEIEVTPGNTDLQLYYIQVLLKVWQNPDNAREQMQALIKTDLGSEQLLSTIVLSIEQEWYSEASELLHQLRELPGQSETAEYFLGRVSEFEDKKGLAIDWYGKVSNGQYHALARLRAAALLSQQNKLTEALSIASTATPTHPEDIKLLALIELEVLSKMGSYDEAFVSLSEALGQLPFETDLLYIRALLAEKLNNLKVAENDLRLILRIYPNHVESLNALGYILANRTDRLVEALALVEKAQKLSPNNAGVLDSLGWVHFKMGDFAAAERYLQEAWNLNPQPLIAAHLGEVLFVTGHEDRANSLWATALSHSPNDEYLLEALNRLMPAKAQASNDLDTQ